MKLYKHEYSMTHNKLQTFEYEAEEKEKSYSLTEVHGRLLKKDIDVLYDGCCLYPFMFSLSPDPSFFLSSLLSFVEEEIKREEERLEKKRKNKECILFEIEKRK